MNTNINNYTTDELIELVQLPVKPSYTLDEVYYKVLSCIRQVKKVDDNNNSKADLIQFLIKAFQQICSSKSLKYDSSQISNLEKEIEDIRTEILNANVRHTHMRHVSEHIVLMKDQEQTASDFNLQVRNGDNNPLKKHTYRQIININTRFRNNYFNTKSTDFLYNLPFELKNVISMRALSVEIPNCMYIFSADQGTNEFTIETFDVSNGGGGDPEYLNEERHVIKIREGKYSGKELEEYLNTYVFNPGTSDSPLARVACKFNETSCKFQFFYDERDSTAGGAGPYGDGGIEKRFNIDFRSSEDKNRPIQLNMGWILGYRQPYYYWDKHYVPISKASYDRYDGYNPESTYDFIGSKYFLLAINDFNKNFSNTIISPFQEGIMRENGVLAKIPNTPNNDNTLIYDSIDDVNEDRIYNGPVNIDRMHIQLLDELGRPVDLINQDYAFTLSVEIDI